MFPIDDPGVELRGGPLADADEPPPILRIENLQTHIRLKAGVVKAVDGVSLTIRRGETVGLVGESGSGKTMTLLSIMRLLPVASAQIVGGHIWFEGRDLLQEPESAMRRYRGARIGLIMQDALTALNPVLSIGDQMTEPLRYHQGP